MLISLNWLKKYVDIQIDNDELVKLIGARLVEVEDVIDNTHKYDKIYAVRVNDATKIEGTHLSLCHIDDGGKAEGVERDENGLVQVMCGAPNVHAGMYAAWIAPGAIVPSTYGTDEPFEIGVRKMLKQYDSYGMMAGADELDLGDDHSGIVELDPANTQPGDDFAQKFELDDIILDIENKSLTHRPDTFGIIGFAREVAGILGQEFKNPDWLFETSASFKNADDCKLNIEISDYDICPRYTAIVSVVDSKPEHTYLTMQDTLLARSGMRPIDPIVDATNYLMLLSGQPLHAFDYDKFVKVGGAKDPKIIIRRAEQGEKLQLLDDKEVELNTDDIVITSNNVPVALAGAMGGKNTEIDENTKRVILESATFSLYNLRKTQMAHGIFSEAITRFTKGQPAGQTLPVALQFTSLLEANMMPIAVFDDQKATETETIEVSIEQINSLLGTDFSIEAAKDILTNVNLEVEVIDNRLKVTVPFWRTDLHIPEDIIEEVGRLSGFDNILPILPHHATSEPNALFGLKTQIRNLLSSYGANETLTYSFIHGDLMRKTGQDAANSYRIVNSISPDLQYIRQSIVPSLIDKSYANLRAGHAKFALFEMNQVYPRTNGFDEDNVPQNAHHLGFLIVDEKAKADYYTAKHYLEKLLSTLGVRYELTAFLESKDYSNHYYEEKRSANIMVGDELIGHLGEIKASVLREFKLPQGTAAFEVDLEKLLQFAGQTQKDFRMSAYPSVSRDVTLTVAGDAVYAKLESQIREILEKQNLIYRLENTSIYQAEGVSTKNVSFHLEFSHPDKTLEKTEIQGIMDSIEKIK